MNAEIWPTAALSDVCSLVTDGTHHSPKNGSQGEYMYVTAKNIRPHGLDLSDITYIDADTHREIYARCPVEHGDVLYIKDGATTGLAAVNHLEKPFSLLSSVALLKPKRDILDSEYLKNWLNSPATMESLIGQMTGSAIRRLVLKQIRQAEIPLPPLSEQRRIVEKIKALTARSRRAREALDALPALIDRYRQSVLAAAFRGDLTAAWRQHHGAVPGAKEIRESLRAQANIFVSEKQRPRKRLETALVDDRPSINLSECPSSWAIMTMEEVTDPARLIQYGILMPGPDIAEGVPYVKVMNIRNDIINVADLRRTTRDIHDQFRRSELKENDVLLTIRGTFGRVALVPSELQGGNITQDTARIAPLSGMVPAYIANYLRCPPVQQYLAKVAKGVAVRGVNIGDLRPMPVPVPPYEEQLEICRELAKALEAVKRLERCVESTASWCSTLDQSILAKAFRGELVPQDPNDEPASVLLERIRAERAAAGPVPRRGRRPKSAGDS